MDIKDIAKCKRELENRILREIREFENLTLVSIDNIELRHVNCLGNHSAGNVIAVNADIRIRW